MRVSLRRLAGVVGRRRECDGRPGVASNGGSAGAGQGATVWGAALPRPQLTDRGGGVGSGGYSACGSAGVHDGPGRPSRPCGSRPRRSSLPLLLVAAAVVLPPPPPRRRGVKRPQRLRVAAAALLPPPPPHRRGRRRHPAAADNASTPAAAKLEGNGGTPCLLGDVCYSGSHGSQDRRPTSWRRLPQCLTLGRPWRPPSTMDR